MALAAAIALPAVLSGSAAAFDDSAALVQATIYNSGGTTRTDTVSVADLQANASQCPTYSGGELEEYGRQGRVPYTPPSTTTWTVGTVLQCLRGPDGRPDPVALANVTGVTVIGDQGSPMAGTYSELTPADLASPSDYVNTAQNPVVEALGSTDQYDRPQRVGSDLDFLDETQTSPIAINVFEGPPLAVTASASPTIVNVGTTIAFRAAVSGNGGSTLSYQWGFDGGAPNSTQAAPQVQFDTAGVWAVSLQVTDSDGGAGVAQLTVTVTQPGSSTTPTTTGSTTTGPDRSSGPTPGGQPTKQKKSGTQNHGTQQTHGKGTHTTSTNTQTTTTQTKTTATQSTTTPVGGPSGGSAGSSGGSSGAGSPSSSANPAGQAATGHTAPKAPTHRPSPKTPPPLSGTPVQGELISDIVPLPADRSPLVHVVAASARGAPARQAPPGRSVLPIAAAVAAILVLFGLGAQRELGRPRWWPALRFGRILRIGH